MTISDAVLAYRLLKSAKLSNSQVSLARATVTELKYEIMKDQLKKISQSETGSDTKTKCHEGTFFEKDSSEEESSYYGRNFRRFNSNRSFNKKFSSVKLNPKDKNNQVTKCDVCQSIYHWANKCPDRFKVSSNSYKRTTSANPVENVSMFVNPDQSTVNNNEVTYLVGESLSMGIGYS